ncbi:hypothetical protein LXL04_011862 [Taraxacum kok-saghyz]
MATNQFLLGLATTSSPLNLQIPPLSIKLDRHNYSLWQTTIISALETFELDTFVLSPNPPAETIPVLPAAADAPPTTAPNPDFQLWKKRDRLVLLWLKSTLSESSLAIVAQSTSSHQAWTAIDKTYQAQTRARRMSMHTELQNLTNGSLSMLEYVEKKRSIADSLAENLHPISSDDLIGHILRGLDGSYGPFITAFMVKDDQSTVDDLIGLLRQEEARLEYDHQRHAVPPPPPNPNSSTLVALNVNRPLPRSNSSGSTSSPSGTRSGDSRRRRTQCQLCSWPGHEAVDCWQRGLSFSATKPRSQPRQSSQAHVAQHHSPSTVIDPAWYFDSGATDHVTPDFQKLNIAEEYNGLDKLQVGNGKLLNISHIASSSLHGLKLPNVLVVPNIAKRLLSVSKLTSDNDIFLEFHRSHCSVKSLQGKTLLNGDIKNGLYRLPSSSNKSSSTMALTGVRTTLHGWHKRLAHPNAPLLRRLLSLFKLPTTSNEFPSREDDYRLLLCREGRRKENRRKKIYEIEEDILSKQEGANSLKAGRRRGWMAKAKASARVLFGEEDEALARGLARGMARPLPPA